MAFTVDQVDIGYGRGWLRPDAAASQFRIDAALGHPQQITEAGRTWAQQDEHYQNYLRYGSPIALSPDTPSVHQLGAAKDTNERLVAFMNDHGWYQTVYRWVNGVWTLVEPWHFEYFSERDNHRNDPAGGGSTPFDPTDHALLRRQKEQDMYISTIAKPEVVYVVFTDRDGREAMRLAGSAETQFAIQAGIVVKANDDPVTNVGVEAGYWIPKSTVQDAVWGTTVDRYKRDAEGEIVNDENGQPIILKISALQELADTKTGVLALQHPKE